VEADEQLMAQIRRLKRINQLTKSLEDRSEQIKFEIAARMKGAELLTSRGKTVATWRSSSPVNRVDVARLRREAPEVASRFITESAPSRRLVIGGARHV
jgi:predicted phage-related endonuclease